MPKWVAVTHADRATGTSPMGPRSGVLGGVDACGPCHWTLRWRPLWGLETLSWAALTHADSATGAVGGAPCGATKRCPGCR
eukprot:4881732-Pyramimonas_sp.AAC.1